MLKQEFPHLIDKLAIGLCGSGSEAFGFDDELSHDHDFEPGFCIFIPDSEKIISRRDEFLLERAYAKLPNEFLGFSRQRLSAVGGNRHGVKRMGNFFEEKIGVPVGAGPYQVSDQHHNTGEIGAGDFLNNNVLYFARNENYVLGAPQIKYLHYQVVPASNLLNALYSGEVDYVQPNSNQNNHE